MHGGLRYLQNFDLGLVREALLERQLMVALAPHLVKPLPLIVPAFDGERPDRKVGVGLNMYDVMAVDRPRSPLARRRARATPTATASRTGRPTATASSTATRSSSGCPALAAARPTSGYLFYDCQTDDARLVLTVLGEAERFGAVFANRCEVLSLVEDGGRATGVNVRDTARRRGVRRCAPAPSSTRRACGRTGCARTSCATRPRSRSSSPSRGTHLLVPSEKLPVVDGAIAPAGSGPDDVRAAVARARR